MPIDYGRLVSRTWEIFWRNRVLWILGFIAAFGSSGLNLNYNFSSRDVTSGSFGAGFEAFWERWGGLVIAGACVLVLIIIALSFLRAAAESALIASTDRIAQTGEPLSFGAAWRLGWPKALRLWLLYIVIGLLAFLAAIAVAIPILLFVSTVITTSSRQTDTGGAPFLLICCACLVMLILIPLAILLVLILQFAPRAIVIDDEGIGQALSSGWRLLRENFWPSIVTGLITIGVGIVQGIVSIPVGLVVAGTGVIALMANPNGLDAGSIIVLIFFGLLAGLLISAIGALFTAFVSVLWTNLYRHLRQKPNGDLSPVAAYPPGGGYYTGQYNQPYGGGAPTGPGAPTTPMQPPYTQPPYGQQPPYGAPPPGQPGPGYPPDQYGGPYGQPPQQGYPPSGGEQGRRSGEQ